MLDTRARSEAAAGAAGGQRDPVGGLHERRPVHARPRFRTFNVIDDFNREGLAIEIDTSLTGARLIRLFEGLRAERSFPNLLRVDNGPEFEGSAFTEWARDNGMFIDFIEPGKPNHNAYIERFNRTYRAEELHLHLFRTLDEVRQITDRWLVPYNDTWPHDALGGLRPIPYAERARLSTYKLFT